MCCCKKTSSSAPELLTELLMSPFTSQLLLRRFYCYSSLSDSHLRTKASRRQFRLNPCPLVLLFPPSFMISSSLKEPNMSKGMRSRFPCLSCTTVHGTIPNLSSVTDPPKPGTTFASKANLFVLYHLRGLFFARRTEGCQLLCASLENGLEELLYSCTH